MQIRKCLDCEQDFEAKRSDNRRCAECQAEWRKRPRGVNLKKELGVGKGGYARKQRRVVCRTCFTIFWTRATYQKVCSTCTKAERDATILRSEQRRSGVCPDCGVAIVRRAGRCRSCATKVRDLTGERNPYWKGGKTHNQGYVYVHNPDATSKSQWRAEHIVVWEQANGPLPKGFVVHHLNGIKTDNRLENLAGMLRLQHHHHPREALVPYEERILSLEELVSNLIGVIIK